MERMKAQCCQLLLIPTPRSLPSPHLIFISGAASTALGRERRNLTPARPATSGAGAPLGGEASWEPEEEPRSPDPRTRPASRIGWRVGQEWEGNEDPRRMKDISSCSHWPLLLRFTHLKLRKR